MRTLSLVLAVPMFAATLALAPTSSRAAVDVDKLAARVQVLEDREAIRALILA